MPPETRTPFAPASLAELFPFPAERVIRDRRPGHVGDQVAVVCRGETVVYETPEALRQAVLERDRQLLAQVRLGGPSDLARRLRQDRRGRQAWQAERRRLALAVCGLAGALAGFALYGAQQLHAAGWP